MAKEPTRREWSMDVVFLAHPVHDSQRARTWLLQCYAERIHVRIDWPDDVTVRGRAAVSQWERAKAIWVASDVVFNVEPIAEEATR